MANSKLMRKAQEKNQYSENKSSGLIDFKGLSSELKKSQIKKCEPFKFLELVCKKIKVKRKECFGKILFTNTSGQVKLTIARGKNTDQASASKEKYLVSGNIFKEKIDSITIINEGKTASKAVEAKKQESTKPIGKQSDKQRPRKKSIKFRKKRRITNYRSRLKTSRKKPVALKDQVTLTDFYDKQANIPESFNSNKSSIPKKDFSSIFEDANLKLYDSDVTEDVEIENPPGVAKYIGLGIDIDRPSILASTELSKIVYDEDTDVFEKLMLDRQYRLESVYLNLENIEIEENEETLESSKKTLAEQQLLIDDALTTINTLTSLDDEIVQELSVKLYDLAQTLGFSRNLKLTQIYAQVLSDLGAASEFGVYRTERGQRYLGSDSQITISNNYNNAIMTGRTPYQALVKSGQSGKDISDPLSFAFGSKESKASYLAYYDEDNNINNRSKGKNLGNSGIRISGFNGEEISLMQSIFTELLLSRLIAEGDPNILAMKQRKTTNLVSQFMGDFRDPSKSLNSIKTPTGLSSIMKFNTSGDNFYPLEQFLQNGSGIKGRTFLDAVVQPAIGSFVENNDPNFDLLNSWVESSNSSLDDCLRYLNASLFDGGSIIVLNEIILAFVNCVVDPGLKIGNKKHSFSNKMIRKINYPSSTDVRRILDTSFKIYNSLSSRSLGHIYNTFGYSFFEGQDYLVRLARYTTLGKDLTFSDVDDYKIGPGNKWNPNKNRSINDGNIVSKILNNIYEEHSRYFDVLENSIMTSIELLLSDAGLLKSNPNNDYYSEVGGYFENGIAETNSGSSAGNYEKTLFSGMPRFYLRALLAKCCAAVRNTNLLSSDKNLIRSAKTAVENLDLEAGPVRWKVTRGSWPPENQDYEDLDDNVYNALVPSSIRQEFETGGVEVEVDTDSDGNVESVNVQDPLASWRFIESKEGFCPITLLLEGEDNSVLSTSFVRGNRSLFDSIFDDVITTRNYLYRSLSFIRKPIEMYQKFPEKLEESLGSISADSIKELATLPGIDGQELVKFTTVNQISNFKVTNYLESPSPGLRYLPNKLLVSNNEYRVAKAFVDTYMNKKFSREDLALVHTVGIPCGYLNSNTITGLFSLSREAEYMFFPDQEWSTKNNLFHPFVYIIPGSFNNCSPGSSYLEIVQDTKYFISDGFITSFMNFTECKEYLNLTEQEALDCLSNHVLDASLKMVLKITTGMDMSEDTFKLNKDSNKKYVSKDNLKLIESFLSKYPEKYKDYFSEGIIKDIRKITNVDEESTILEINNFVSSIECRLISPEQIAKKTFSTRLFDRVFCLFTHPDEHYSNERDKGKILESRNIDIDGISKRAYQIDLKDRLNLNSVKNDHFASYYFRVIKQ